MRKFTMKKSLFALAAVVFVVSTSIAALERDYFHNEDTWQHHAPGLRASRDAFKHAPEPEGVQWEKWKSFLSKKTAL